MKRTAQFGLVSVLLVGILCGCATQADIRKARDEVIVEVDEIAESAAVRHGIDEDIAREIGVTAGKMAGAEFIKRVDDKKGSVWGGVVGLIMAGLQVFAAGMKA